MTVRSLFTRASRWTKGDFTKGEGQDKCYCLLGALQHVHKIDRQEDATRREYDLYKRARIRTENVLATLFPNRCYPHDLPRRPSIAHFNDHELTTIEDIRRVARLARI